MKRSTLVAVSANFLLGLGQLLTAHNGMGGEFMLRGCTLSVPDGFTVQLAGDESVVRYPICADFDHRGRLYVAEASGREDWNQPQPDASRHRVLRLEDTDGDGQFDHRTVYAEFEMLPQGSMWLDGSLYVAAAPVIWKLTDTDDDGVAESREKWIETEEVTVCLNDLRGPYLGPDGWIYWCKGAGVKQTYQVDGQPWSTVARHIFRRHPDRQDVQQVMVGGMDNPVEVAFSRGGERFLTNTNIQLVGQPRKDGILHAVYGGVYPKDISPVFDFPWSGPTMMPELTSWDALSPAGLMRYESAELGEQYRDNLFSALFSGHQVMRHVLRPSGATFEAHDEAFLSCEDVQFHPTDVLEDADGSLLVVETGGWYLHCCPSSTFYRPDRHGAIYRIRRDGAHQIDDPRGNRIDWARATPEQLAKLLGDGRVSVRRRAADGLAKRGAEAVPALRRAVGDEGIDRCLAVWAATRIETSEARAVVRLALNDKDSAVRHAALSSVSLWRDREALPQLLSILDAAPDSLRRVAAEALGRIGERSVVPALLQALATPSDRFLEHSLTHALIEIADTEGTEAGLSHPSVHTRRAALIALDQMPGGKLDSRHVVKELYSDQPGLQEAAWWIASRHSRAWGTEIAASLRGRLEGNELGDREREILIARLSQVARAPELAGWLVAELTRPGTSAETQVLILKSMADAGGLSAERSWVAGMLELLEKTQNQTVRSQLITTLSRLPPLRFSGDEGTRLYNRFNDQLRLVAGRSDLSDADRLTALTAIRGTSLGEIDDNLFNFLMDQLAPDRPLGLRSTAADMLARSVMTEAQLLRLAAQLEKVAAPELNRLLDAFERNQSNAVGHRLVASLTASPAATTLNVLRLNRCLAGFAADVKRHSQPLLKRLEQSQAEQLAQAHRIAALVADADPHRGLQVFRSNRSACIACHKAAYLGGTTGPSLRMIGTRRSEQDLVESILFPSASLVQGYETWNVLTTDGRIVSGVIKTDSPTELVLATGPEKTVAIPREAIEEVTRSDVSTMPAGLEKTLTEQQLADLVAYLKSLH